MPGKKLSAVLHEPSLPTESLELPADGTRRRRVQTGLPKRLWWSSKWGEMVAPAGRLNNIKSIRVNEL